jgi:hypothetical protein
MPDPEAPRNPASETPAKGHNEEHPDALHSLTVRMPKFNLGQTVITANANAVLTREDVRSALLLHSRGDWGDICPEDRKVNERGVLNQGMILSSYQSAKGVKFWVITDPGHEVTTVLLPDDY